MSEYGTYIKNGAGVGFISETYDGTYSLGKPSLADEAPADFKSNLAVNTLDSRDQNLWSRSMHQGKNGFTPAGNYKYTY